MKTTQSLSMRGLNSFYQAIGIYRAICSGIYLPLLNRPKVKSFTVQRVKMSIKLNRNRNPKPSSVAFALSCTDSSISNLCKGQSYFDGIINLFISCYSTEDTFLKIHLEIGRRILKSHSNLSQHKMENTLLNQIISCREE